MSVETTAAERDSNRLIEGQLNQRAEALEAAFGGSHVLRNRPKTRCRQDYVATD
jgi:hypothetical protein